MSDELSIHQKLAVGRITGLVILNAMIFQEVLSGHDNRVESLKTTLSRELPAHALADHWEYILKEINYYPIFHVASQLIITISTGTLSVALKFLADSASKIMERRTALRHDLMGRVYHRLLVEAKFLGTYYTGIPAATLLLKLALRPEARETGWHSLEGLSEFRVADLACGTGTLLMAAADALTDNYIHDSAEKETTVDINGLNRVMAEHVLCGYDVLPSAIHLTASTIALRAPEVTFTKMNLFSLPLGGTHRRLGSIEFLKDKCVADVTDLFGAVSETAQVVGKATEEQASKACVPDIDLCVMNPPFTRSVGGNLLFGSLPDEERKAMQKELKALIAKNNIPANVTAGLGAVFVAMADSYIKPGGRLALVLPKALISGVSWEPTRELIRQKYVLEYLVVSHDPERWNFSESTDLSEVLLVARKKRNGGPEDKRPALTAINLWRNPSTPFDALAIAYQVSKGRPPEIPKGQGALNLTLGDTKLGEAIAYSLEDLDGRPTWMLPCAFAQSDLIRSAYQLVRGKLRMPGYKKGYPVPLCPLSDLGTLGPDVRDIHDGFRQSKAVTAYPAFWSHDAQSVLSIGQSPNNYLSPLHEAKEGRNLRKAEDLWPRSGRVLIAERLWLKTMRLTSVVLPRPVLSNVWWPLALKPKVNTYQNEKIISMWLNSTLGLLILLSRRLETRGAWVKFKKPILSGMPVLDVRALSAAQRKALAAAYARVSKETLLPLPEMHNDPVRKVIDEAFAKVLGLPDLTVLRELLAQEPVVCLRQL